MFYLTRQTDDLKRRELVSEVERVRERKKQRGADNKMSKAKIIPYLTAGIRT